MCNIKVKVPQIMKGIAIALIVLHHSLAEVYGNGNGWVVSFISAINAVHVAVFFFLSGFFMQKELSISGVSFYRFKKRVIRLGIPYISWQLLFYSVIALLAIMPEIKKLLSMLNIPMFSPFQEIINLLTFRQYQTQIFWYLYVLMIYTFLSYILQMLSIDFFKQAVLVCTLYLIIPRSILPYVLSKAFDHLVEFWFGRILYSYRTDFFEKNEIVNNKRLLVIPCFILFAVGRYTMPVFICNMGLVDRIIKIIYTFMGVYSIYLLALLMTQKKIKCFELIGNYSYEIYLTHQPWVVATMGGGISLIGLPDIISAVIIFICAIAFPILLSIIIRRNKYLEFLMYGVSIKTHNQKA